MPLLLCPNCNTSMQALQRSGVELDICPQCRGVWLDRGELEKIIDQATTRPPEDLHRNERPDRPDHGRPSWGHDDHDRHDRHDHDDRNRHGHKRRGSIFDIFD
jgi:Zn-finger nucleic acid-binding protein